MGKIVQYYKTKTFLIFQLFWLKNKKGCKNLILLIKSISFASAFTEVWLQVTLTCKTSGKTCKIMSKHWLLETKENMSQ